ncbi:hypothetical protein ABZZ79_12085 [Streptomyces sp. NPDC006458]|uniref:hypothetical protein n=1 Tax=Streptomyces sp. NPDC006458 TaxID=3154302 RepID=UPI0033AC7185
MPDVRGALVMARRQRRDSRAQGEAWKSQLQPRAEHFCSWDWEDTPLVRPYVGALDTSPRTARTGAQGAPWGNAQ